jgi:hypothetical protein
MLVSAIRRHTHKWLLKSALSVPQHARADARQNPPQPGNAALSPTEIKLVEHFEHRLATLAAERDHALRSERVNVIANDLTAAERSFADLVRDTKSDIDVALLKFTPHWREALQRIDERLLGLDHFKREHRLARDAVYPSRLLTGGILAMAFVTETLANAALFAEVSRWGLIGGATNAMALSLPNLALGFAAGFWGLRGRNHMHPHVRWLATILTAVTMAAAAIYNFYVAHVRARAELHINSRQPLLLSDWQQVGEQMLTHPALVFASAYAVALFTVGLFVFAIATYEGLDGWADRYPGFARVDRRLRAAMGAAETLKWQFFGRLARLTRRGRARIDQRVRGIDKKGHDALRILDRAQSVMTSFAQRATDHLWAYRATVRDYQFLNRMCRGNNNIPARFDQPLSPDATLPAYDWPAMRDQIRAAVVAATRAADQSSVALDEYRLRVMRDIDSPTMPVTAVPTLQTSASRPAKESL